MSLRGTGRAEGGSVRVELRTLNLGVGHAFPAGPSDLHEHWIELCVVDAAGRTIHHEGELLPDGRVPDGVIRLGGHGLTAEGRPIEKHRIFDIARVEGVRRLHDELLTDVRDVPLPPDGRGPWEVRARWLFRRAPPVFSRWALDREDAEMPVWELAGTRFVVEAS